MIQLQDDPERMRAFLLVAVFFDQLMHSRFQALHEDFYKEFTVPKLLAHGGCGCARPDWLLNHDHGFDVHVDWKRLGSLASGAFSEVLDWIQNRRPIEHDEFTSIVSSEILDTFETEHQERLLRAFRLHKTPVPPG